MDVFDYLIMAAIGAVTLTLLAGIVTLYRAGDRARSTSNKLMRLRVLLQTLAVIVLLLSLWWRSTQGG